VIRLPDYDPTNVFFPESSHSPRCRPTELASHAGQHLHTVIRLGRAHSFTILFPELRRRSELRSTPVTRADHVLPCYIQKCVPGPRRCVRCTRMEIEDCIYEPVKKRGVGKTLRMGEACASCRLAKPHGGTMNYALTFGSPRDAHQSKKEGERMVLSMSSDQLNL
jgi:hypothetical protein